MGKIKITINKFIFLDILIGTVIGYLVLSPFAMIVSDRVHRHFDVTYIEQMRHSLYLSITEVFHVKMWPWALSFAFFGGIIGLLYGIKQRKIQEQRNQLIEANKICRQNSFSYMEMLGFVSHELKNPLTNIIGYASLFEEGELGKLDEKQGEAIDAILGNTRYIQSLIINYLDLSRIEKNELTMKPKLIDIYQAVIKPVLSNMKSQLEDKDVQLSFNLTGFSEKIMLEVDPKLMMIVFNNLCNNAAKYAKKGTVIDCGCEDKGAFYQFNVRNEGGGIPQEHLETIFEKFIRLEGKTTFGKKGSGLGLYITKHIIEQHGGHIWAESEEGKWANFIFTLPK